MSNRLYLILGLVLMVACTPEPPVNPLTDIKPLSLPFDTRAWLAANAPPINGVDTSAARVFGLTRPEDGPITVCWLFGKISGTDTLTFVYGIRSDKEVTFWLAVADSSGHVLSREWLQRDSLTANAHPGLQWGNTVISDPDSILRMSYPSAAQPGDTMLIRRVGGGLLAEPVVRITGPGYTYSPSTFFSCRNCPGNPGVVLGKRTNNPELAGLSFAAGKNSLQGAVRVPAEDDGAYLAFRNTATGTLMYLRPLPGDENIRAFVQRDGQGHLQLLVNDAVGTKEVQTGSAGIAFVGCPWGALESAFLKLGARIERPDDDAVVYLNGSADPGYKIGISSEEVQFVRIYLPTATLGGKPLSQYTASGAWQPGARPYWAGDAQCLDMPGYQRIRLVVGETGDELPTEKLKKDTPIIAFEVY